MTSTNARSRVKAVIAIVVCAVLLTATAPPGYVMPARPNPADCKIGDQSVADYQALSGADRTLAAQAYRSKFERTLSQTRTALSGMFANTPLQVSGRLKSTASLKEKILRPSKNYRCLSEITDVAGTRVIIPDYAALPHVTRTVRQRFEIVEEQNKIHNDGYRAVHYLVEVDGRIAEVQIHTLRGTLWADASHKLDYKGPFKGNAALRTYLNELSLAVYLLDSGFSATLPSPPGTLPQAAKASLDKTVTQMAALGRPDPSKTFLVMLAGEEPPPETDMVIRLEALTGETSVEDYADYYGLDEFGTLEFRYQVARREAVEPGR